MIDFDPGLIPGRENIPLPKSGAGVVAIEAHLASVCLPNGVRPANIYLSAGYVDKTCIEAVCSGESIYDGPPMDSSVDFTDRPVPYRAGFDKSTEPVSLPLDAGGDLRVLTYMCEAGESIGSLGLLGFQRADREIDGVFHARRLATPPEGIALPNAPEAQAVLAALARMVVPNEDDAAWLALQLTPPPLPRRKHGRV